MDMYHILQRENYSSSYGRYNIYVRGSNVNFYYIKSRSRKHFKHSFLKSNCHVTFFSVVKHILDETIQIKYFSCLLWGKREPS